MICGERPIQEALVEVLDVTEAVVGRVVGPYKGIAMIDTLGRRKTVTDGYKILMSLTYPRNINTYDKGMEDAFFNMIKEPALKIDSNRSSGDGPQPLYSKIATPNGWITMGDAKVGDIICGTNGTYQQIVGVYPKGQREVIIVVFADGREVQCCKDHLWQVVNCNTQPKLEVTTIEDMIASGVVHDDSGNKRYNYYTPVSYVDYNTREQLLDAYLVGVLLGDGSLKDSGSIEISLGESKKHILDKLIYPEGIQLNSRYDEKKHYWRCKFSGKDKNGKSMHDLIRAIGLINTDSHSKFIPDSYLHTSYNDRQRLLQGLLDTDGHLNRSSSNGRCGLYSYSTVSDTLNMNIIELMRGLGHTVTTRIRTRENDPNSYSNNPIHCIEQLKGYQYGNKIIDIIETGEKTEMQCIKVSNPDHLYITDDHVVTHNTSAGSIMSILVLRSLITDAQKESTSNEDDMQKTYHDIYDEMMSVTIGDKKYTVPTVEREPLIQDILDTFVHAPVQKYNMKAELSENMELYRDVLHNLGFTSCGDDSITKTFIDAYIKGGAKAFIQIADSPTGEDHFESYDGVYQCDEVTLTRRSQANNTQQNAFMIEDSLPIICIEDKIESDQADLVKYILEDDTIDQIVLLTYGVNNIVNAMIDTYFREHGVHKIILISISMGADQSLNFVDDISVVTGAALHRSVDLLMQKVVAFYDENNEQGYFDLGVGFIQGDSMLSVHGIELNLKTIGDTDAIDKRIDYLRKFIDGAKEDVKIKGNDVANIGAHQRRLSSFEGTNVKVYIGGKTAAAVASRSYLAEDAQRAISNAITEGILPGYFFLYRHAMIESMLNEENIDMEWDKLPVRSQDILLRMCIEKDDAPTILHTLISGINQLLLRCINEYTGNYILSSVQNDVYLNKRDTFINTVNSRMFTFTKDMDFNTLYGKDGIDVLDTAMTQKHIIDMMFSLLNTMGNTRLFMSSLELERNDIEPMTHLKRR